MFILFKKSSALHLSVALLSATVLLTGCGKKTVSTRKANVASTNDNQWGDDDPWTEPTPTPTPSTNLSPAIKPPPFRVIGTASAELPTAGVNTDGKLVVKIFALAPDSLGATGISTQYGPSNYVPHYACAQYSVTLQVQDEDGTWLDTHTEESQKLLVGNTNPYETAGSFVNPCQGAVKSDVIDFSSFVQGRGTGKVRLKVDNIRTDKTCYMDAYNCGSLQTVYHTHNVKGKVYIQTDTTTLE